MAGLGPARIYPLESASMSFGFCLSVEFPLSFEAASFTCSLPRNGLVEITPRQEMAAPAVRHGPPNDGNNRFLANISVWQNLRTKNSLNRLPIPKPTDKGGPSYSKFSAPLSSSKLLPVEFYNDIIASVISLFNTIGPFTIFRAIVAIIIDAFDRASRRTFAHICKKVRKHLPSFANCYSATAIIFIASRSWSGASGKNSIPNFIGFRIRHAMRGATHQLFSIDQELYYGI